MAERPILFSGPMVRAILDGRKTVTRRVVKPQPLEVAPVDPTCPAMPGLIRFRDSDPCLSTFDDACPYGGKGARLWVRETWRLGSPYEDTKLSHFHDPEEMLFDHVHYAADDFHRHELAGQYRPSIFMPRWASRLTLEIISVRIERLQGITDAECRAEGICLLDEANQPEKRHRLYVRYFRELWDKLNGKKYPWESNPWVWRIEFRKEDANG